MRTLTASERNTLLNGTMIKHHAIVKYVKFVPLIGELETIIPNVIDIQVSMDDASFASSANFKILNVNNNNIKDWNYFTPYRKDAAHNKPQNDWYNVLVANTKIKIYAGVDTSQCIFTGYIQTVDITNTFDNCIMNVKCLDLTKVLLEQYCNQTVTSTNTRVHEYIIPIQNDVTPKFLTVTDTNPPLEDILTDICMRANLPSSDFDFDATGKNLEDVIWSIQNNGMFSWVKWADIIEQLKTITNYDFRQDADGIFKFKKKQNTNINIVDEVQMLSGEDWAYLSNPMTLTVVVKNWDGSVTFHEGTDYEFDMTKCAIRRIATGNIEDLYSVKVSYSSVSFIFSEGINIKDIQLTLSSENIYAWVRVNGNGCGYSLRTTAHDQMWDGSKILPDSVYVVDAQELITEADCKALATKLKSDMLERYVSIELNVIPCAHLQIGDIIQIKVYGLVTEAYIITSINYSITASCYEQKIKCHHYQYASS